LYETVTRQTHVKKHAKKWHGHVIGRERFQGWTSEDRGSFTLQQQPHNHQARPEAD